MQPGQADGIVLSLLMGFVVMNFLAFAHFFATSSRNKIGSLLVCLPNLYCFVLLFFALALLARYSLVPIGEPVVADLRPHQIIFCVLYFGLTALCAGWFGHVYRASWPRVPIQLFTAGLIVAALEIIATSPD